MTITLAPMARTICNALNPSPPRPKMTTVSVGSTRPIFVTAWYAVKTASVATAACADVTPVQVGSVASVTQARGGIGRPTFWHQGCSAIWDSHVRCKGAVLTHSETMGILAQLWVAIPALEAGPFAAAGNGEHSYSGALSMHTSDVLGMRDSLWH